MKINSHDGTNFGVDFAKNELIALVGALNEVCNGVDIDEWDFETRIGIPKTLATKLLADLGALLKSYTK